MAVEGLLAHGDHVAAVDRGRMDGLPVTRERVDEAVHREELPLGDVRALARLDEKVPVVHLCVAGGVDPLPERRLGLPAHPLQTKGEDSSHSHFCSMQSGQCGFYWRRNCRGAQMLP